MKRMNIHKIGTVIKIIIINPSFTSDFKIIKISISHKLIVTTIKVVFQPNHRPIIIPVTKFLAIGIEILQNAWMGPKWDLYAHTMQIYSTEIIAETWELGKNKTGIEEPRIAVSKYKSKIK